MEVDKQKSNVVQLYSAFAVSLILHFVPDAFLGSLGFFLLLAVLIVSYFLRSKAEEHNLMHNHTTYIIGTIWLGSLYLGIGIIVASILLQPRIDVSPVYDLVDSAMAGNISHLETDKIMKALFDQNKDLLLFIGAPLIAPGILFFIYRCVYGVSRSIKGYRVSKPKSWL